MPAAPRTDALNNLFSLLGMGGFAIAWYLAGIFTATAVLMGILTVQLLAGLAVSRRLHKPTLFTWLLVLALGSLTLLLRDKAFIQLKTTLVYGAFAAALFIADRIGKNLPRLLLQQFFDAPAALWRRVSHLMAGYFLLLALINLAVARYLSEGAWVAIKTFAFPAATLLFMLLLMGWLYRHAGKKEEGSAP